MNLIYCKPRWSIRGGSDKLWLLISFSHRNFRFGNGRMCRTYVVRHLASHLCGVSDDAICQTLSGTARNDRKAIRMPSAFDSVKRVCVTCQLLRTTSPIRKRDFSLIRKYTRAYRAPPLSTNRYKFLFVYQYINNLYVYNNSFSY